MRRAVIPSAHRVRAAINAASKVLNVPAGTIAGWSRSKEPARARHVVIDALVATGRYSLSAVGRGLGGRDHTTIVNSLRKSAILRAQIPAYQAAYEAAHEAAR